MIRLFPRVVVLGLLVATILYVTLSNSEPATLRLGPSVQFAGSAGVLYLAAFAAGILIASVVALYFGFKEKLRERKLRSLEKQRQSFFELFRKGRCLMAAGEWGAAQSAWEQVLRRDPNNSIALVELATCLEQVGEARQALNLLDQLRSQGRAEADVLFKAAQLSHQLGNFTAARDNLALLAAEFPSRKALEMARDVSAQLQRFDEALAYHEQLQRSGWGDQNSAQTAAHLAFMNLEHTAAAKPGSDDSTLRQALKEFTKRNPGCAEALDRLAELELSSGLVDEAAESLVKAAKAAPDQPNRWLKVVDLWIRRAPGDLATRAERAIAAARSAGRNLSGGARVEAELVLTRTLLALHRHTDAEKVLEGVPALARQEGVALEGARAQQLLALRGVCLARLNRISETASLWEELGDLERVRSGAPNGSEASHSHATR